MYKIQWDEVRDEYKHCFAVCNYESAMSLYHNLVRAAETEVGGTRPINIRIFDLSGNETSISKLAPHGEWTHKDQ